MFDVRRFCSRALGLAGLSLVFVACGGDDEEPGSSGASLAQLCGQVCEKTDALACPNDGTDCASQCESEAAMFQGCESQSQAYMNCLAGRLGSDFECGDDGESTPKDGVCSSQADALGTCVFASLGGGGAGAGGTGGSGGGAGGPDSCDFANDGECDEPDFCPVGTDTTDCGG